MLNHNPNTFAEAIGVAPTVIYNIIGRRLSKPSFDVLQKVIKSFDRVNPSWLLSGEGYPLRNEPKYDETKIHQIARSNEKLREIIEDREIEYERDKENMRVFDEHHETYTSRKPASIQPLTVTVDHKLNEVITFVPTKAQAGYLVGYGDPEFIQKLPAFSFPGFSNGIYRAFEVQGFSMLQYEGAGLYPTDIVIGQFMEDARQVKDNRVYIIASDEGLLIKRCINRLETAGKLICNSDNANGDYPPIILNDYQIKEVWEFKGKFSRQIPKATRVFEEITDLQAKMTLMAEELKKTNQRVNMLLPGNQEK